MVREKELIRLPTHTVQEPKVPTTEISGTNVYALIEAESALNETIEPWIDVSHWQESRDGKIRMNWALAKEKGIKGAGLKMTEGNYFYDSSFKYNLDTCISLDMPNIWYHYVRPSISYQAQYTWIKSKMPSEPNDSILALDCENTDGRAFSVVTSCIIGLCKSYADHTGHRPWIYTNQWFGNSLSPWAEWVEHPLWVASYTSALQPSMPKYWIDWEMWQYKVLADGTPFGTAPGAGLDMDQRKVRVPNPPLPPSIHKVLSHITVNIDGIDYDGNVELLQVKG